jgi:hypothetical protein
MTRAKIKSVEITESPDLNPQHYLPQDLESFGCTLGLTIGPSNGEGGELFYLTACSPKWLAMACKKDGFLWGRYHLIVPEYNLKAILQIVTKFVDNCSGESWNSVAGKLARFANWEYEDYEHES